MESPTLSMRDKVLQLEDVLTHMPQADCPVRHHFAPGVYAREITIPKGVTLVGAIHKIENLAVLSAGKLILATENGPVEITAPHILTVSPGAKNAAFAVEDSVWTNFFATDETDTAKLVELLTESKECELLGGAENKQLLTSGKQERIEA